MTDAVGAAEESRECLSGEAATTVVVLSFTAIAATDSTVVVVVVVLVGHCVCCNVEVM